MPDEPSWSTVSGLARSQTPSWKTKSELSLSSAPTATLAGEEISTATGVTISDALAITHVRLIKAIAGTGPRHLARTSANVARTIPVSGVLARLRSRCDLVGAFQETVQFLFDPVETLLDHCDFGLLLCTDEVGANRGCQRGEKT